MIDRFAGESGRRVLVEALKTQKLVNGNADLADRIATVGELIEVEPAGRIIEQGGFDNAIYFILGGSFEIVVNGRRVGARGPNDHVGEMAAIMSYLPRSASVVAQTRSVVLKLTEPEFAKLGADYPGVWCCIAKELAHRLMQRNALVNKARTSIRVFVISSVEALEVARAIQSAFQHDPFFVVVWTDGVFRASQYSLESLERELVQSDFAIAVAQPDDLTESRGQLMPSPRDNVMFELAFFMGSLGRHRTFLVEPRGNGDELKLPTDLKGINTVKYKYLPGKDLAAAVGPACSEIRQIIMELGPNN
jgi:CRP/FNR family transcriptional regulator, cyclic AMP receptor protein